VHIVKAYSNPQSLPTYPDFSLTPKQATAIVKIEKKETNGCGLERGWWQVRFETSVNLNTDIREARRDNEARNPPIPSSLSHEQVK
jgi:hypothetical protein